MDMLREPGRRADAHIARYVLAASLVRYGDVVLDAACGLGYGSAILASAAPSVRVIGVDNSEYAVNYAAWTPANTRSITRVKIILRPILSRSFESPT
jgi:methylase of polypeptide subunit release factors